MPEGKIKVRVTNKRISFFSGDGKKVGWYDCEKKEWVFKGKAVRIRDREEAD